MITTGGDISALWKEFSEKLEKSCLASFEQAAYKIFAIHQLNPPVGSNPNIIPLRPILLGGDDIAVIIRADLALTFTETFLTEFQKNTMLELESLHQQFHEGLTACAGIAYVKQNFPFHYAYHLSEELCKSAKSKAKSGNSSRSAVQFTKIQDSFYDSIQEIREREFLIHDYNFEYGPYFLHESEKDIQWLSKIASALNKEKGIKSALRHWLEEVHDTPDLAKRRIHRLRKTHQSSFDRMKIEKFSQKGDSPILDWMTIASLNE